MIEANDPRWRPSITDPPKTGEHVLGLLEHWNTKGHELVELKAVDEGDCSFRTADDNSEIDYNWTPTHWMPIPDDWKEMKASLAEEKIKDIKEHPENHKHTYVGLRNCCTIDGATDISVMEAHSKYVDIGTNGGVKCDVTEGPCSCGAWHE